MQPNPLRRLSATRLAWRLRGLWRRLGQFRAPLILAWTLIVGVGVAAVAVTAQTFRANAAQAETSHLAPGQALVAGAYRNCAAAHAAGDAPVRRGDPGYGPHLDRDNDGVGCEPYPL